jgi:hypothetical protein
VSLRAGMQIVCRTSGRAWYLAEDSAQRSGLLSDLAHGNQPICLDFSEDAIEASVRGDPAYSNGTRDMEGLYEVIRVRPTSLLPHALVHVTFHMVCLEGKLAQIMSLHHGRPSRSFAQPQA